MDASSTLRLHTGREMPVLGIGTWQLKRDTAGTIAAALDAGYRMIDTSGDYGTQPGVGEGIRQSAIDREDVYLVTKIEEDDDAYEATRANLHELELDQADMMLIHRPPSRGFGKQLWEGLIRARDEGLVRDIGVSNYSIEQIESLVDSTGEVPAVNQIEWTPFGWNREMYDYCRAKGVVIQAYSPLARKKRLDDDRIEELADGYGKTVAQVLLRWNLQMGVAPLPKANQREHFEENLDIFDFELSKRDMALLDSLNEEWSSLGRALLYV